MFRLFADLIAAHLDSAERLDRAETEAFQQRSQKELREQFIAVLGHDLRNPLASIAAGVKMLKRGPDEAKSEHLLALMEGSVIRMNGLIDNVLDFARSRMGSKLVLREPDLRPVGPVLDQIVDELRSVHPGRIIETDFDVAEPFSADHLRLARLFSNLLGNALVHGINTQPVRISASTEDGRFVFSVANSGRPIPQEVIDNLFQPFVRGKGREQQGLGLGLYIASEIAKMHGGTLKAVSNDDGTSMTFTMPIER